MSNFFSGITIVLSLFLGCKYETPLEPVPEFYTVKYEITGTAQTVSVTWIPEYGEYYYSSSRYLPFIYEFSFKKPSGTEVMVSAKGKASSDSVIVIIYRDNYVFLSDTSIGDQIAATARGVL